MKKTATIMAALVVAMAANAATVRTATETFVTNKIAAAVAAIPAPDYSTNNTALVETIQARAPAPGNYAAVSNAAMSAAQPGDIAGKQDALPYPTNAIPFAAIADAPGGMTTNDVCNIVTNGVDSGFTAWKVMRDDVDVTGQGVGPYWHDGEDGYPMGKGYEGGLVMEDVTQTDADNYIYAESDTETSLSWIGWSDLGDYGYERHTYTASRDRITRNALGLARLVDLPPLTNGLATAASLASLSSQLSQASQDATNYTDSAIAATDTSYPRVIGITNINQTVQYVSIDSDVPTTLSIMLPTSGDTKDWIVYVTAQTNVTINLPAATWWLADTSATNDIAPQTPTALFFSQAADNIFTMGRQEFTEVVLP